MACEADAKDMAAIVKDRKFKKIKTLLTKTATLANVRNEITKSAETLKSGDIFLLSYSGHGGQLPDLNDEEADAQDETWCLYDGEQVDDELYAMLGKFAKGVRVLVFSDSCHSGTVTKLAYYQGTAETRSTVVSAEKIRYRYMPREVAMRTYRENKAFYDPILRDPKLKSAQGTIKASVLLISGCQDSQLSQDGDFNGLFTANMLRVWKEGAFTKDYVKFHQEILKRMPPDQSPNYYRVGSDDKIFEAQNPFTV